MLVISKAAARCIEGTKYERETPLFENGPLWFVFWKALGREGKRLCGQGSVLLVGGASASTIAY